MRKCNDMVSLNPEYGIEVTALGKIADSVRDSNPELYNILTILIASLLANDETKFLDYCNRYLEDKVQSSNIKSEISKMLEDYLKNQNEDY